MKRGVGLRLSTAFLALAIFSQDAHCAEGFIYQAKGRRDPFMPLVGQESRSNARLQDVSSIDELRLEGIAEGGLGKKIAIINGEMLKERDRIGNLEIKKVSSRSVKLLISGKEYNLSLPEEGGNKSAR